MKKIFLLLLFTLKLLSISAQQTFLVWNNGKASLQPQLFDSLTFTLPDHPFTLVVGDPSTLTSSYMQASMVVKSDKVNVSASSGKVGVCWSASKNTPTTSDNDILVGTYDSDIFHFTISNLNKSTKYYYRPYITVNGQTWYGEVKSFTTPDNGSAAISDYIDLGLSVKWARCNLGASSPQGYGLYYAWGELSAKDSYEWSNYQWSKGVYGVLTKYCTNKIYGYDGLVDKKYTLEASDDAATQKLGYPWRMPTRTEFQELIDNCSWTWQTQNGVNGYMVVSKKNGNSIFLPVAGSCYSSNLSYTGIDGNYWSSTIDRNYGYDYCNHAWYLHFGKDYLNMDFGERCLGFAVRPVHP